MKQIPVGKKHFALVDDADYDDLIQFSWEINKSVKRVAIYAQRRWQDNGKRRSELMHKRITGFKQTDHVNGDGLDNQKHNLRECSSAQNRVNQGKFRGSYTSQYKGVFYDKRRKKWSANIGINGKRKFLGYFDDEKSAALIYDQKRIKIFW